MAENVQSREKIPVHFDNASKVLKFGPPHQFVGSVTYGQALIPDSQRTAESYLPEFEQSLPSERVSVQEFATKLTAFYKEQFQRSQPNYAGPPMHFYVAGFDEDDAYGRLFQMTVPSNQGPVEMHSSGIGTGFGASWGGQIEVVNRLYKGAEPALIQRIVNELSLDEGQTRKLNQLLAQEQFPIPIEVLALQDCVDLALTLIRTTIQMQRLAIGVRGVGGPIDLVTVTRTEGLKDVQFKEVTTDDTEI